MDLLSIVDRLLELWRLLTGGAGLRDSRGRGIVKQFSYIEQNGKLERTIAEVSDDDTPQKRRVKAMAEAQPERIAVGWAVESPEQSVEKEAYLDELGA